MSTYLVIGASRGIGFGFVEKLGSDPKNTVVATVRKGSNISAIEALNYGNVKLLYVDVGDSSANVKEAFKNLKQLTPNGIDVIIHNAGITDPSSANPLHVQDVDFNEEMFRINASAIVKVYQAIFPRLEENGKPLKYAVITSIVGKLNGMPFQGGAYGASKAAANYYTIQMARERQEKGDIVVPIHPGLVETDMSAPTIDNYKGKVPVLSISEAASSMFSVIEKLKSEDTGKFFDYQGNVWDF